MKISDNMRTGSKGVTTDGWVSFEGHRVWYMGEFSNGHVEYWWTDMECGHWRMSDSTGRKRAYRDLPPNSNERGMYEVACGLSTLTQLDVRKR